MVPAQYPAVTAEARMHSAYLRARLLAQLIPLQDLALLPPLPLLSRCRRLRRRRRLRLLMRRPLSRRPW
jgi:hypothetical protein